MFLMVKIKKEKKKYRDLIEVLIIHINMVNKFLLENHKGIHNKNTSLLVLIDKTLDIRKIINLLIIMQKIIPNSFKIENNKILFLKEFSKNLIDMDTKEINMQLHLRHLLIVIMNLNSIHYLLDKIGINKKAEMSMLLHLLDNIIMCNNKVVVGIHSNIIK